MAEQPSHNPALQTGVPAGMAEAWPLGDEVAGRWQGQRSLQARPALLSAGAVERRERWLAQLSGGVASQPLVHTPLAQALAQALAEAPLLMGKLGAVSRTLSMGELADLVQLVLEEEGDPGTDEHAGSLAATQAAQTPKARPKHQTTTANARPAAAGHRPRRPAAFSASNRQTFAAVRNALRALAHREALAAVAAAPTSLASTAVISTQRPSMATGTTDGAADVVGEAKRASAGVGSAAASAQVQSAQGSGDSAGRREQPAYANGPAPSDPIPGHWGNGLLGLLLRSVSAGVGPTQRTLPLRPNVGEAWQSAAAALHPMGLANGAARAWGLSWLGRDARSAGRAVALGAERDAAGTLSDAVWLALSREADAQAVALDEQAVARAAAAESSGRQNPGLVAADGGGEGLRPVGSTGTTASRAAGLGADPSAPQTAAARQPWRALAGVDALAGGAATSLTGERSFRTAVHTSAAGLHGRRRASAWGPVAAAFASDMAERWLALPGAAVGGRETQGGRAWSFAQSGGAPADLDYVVSSGESAFGLGEGTGGTEAAVASPVGRTQPDLVSALTGATQLAEQASARAAQRADARRGAARPTYGAAPNGGAATVQRLQAAAALAGEPVSGPLAFSQPAAAAGAARSARALLGTGPRRGVGARVTTAAAGLAQAGGEAAQLAQLARISPLWRRWAGRSEWAAMVLRSTQSSGSVARTEPGLTAASAFGSDLAARRGAGADAGAGPRADDAYGIALAGNRALLTLADDPAAPDAAAVATEASTEGGRTLSAGPERPAQIAPSAGRATLANQPPAALRAALQALGLPSRGVVTDVAGQFAAAWFGGALPAAVSATGAAGRTHAAVHASDPQARAAWNWIQPVASDGAGQQAGAGRAERAAATGSLLPASAAASDAAQRDPGLLQLQGFAALAALGLPPADWAALAPSQPTSLAADGGRGQLLTPALESTVPSSEPSSEPSAETSGRSGDPVRTEPAGTTRSGVLGFVPAGLRASRDLLSWDRRAAAWSGPSGAGERWQSRRFGPAVRRGTPRHRHDQARSTAGGWGLEQVGALLTLGDVAEGGYFGEALAGPGQAAAAEALHGAVAARRGATLLRGHAGAVARQSAAAGTGRVGELPAAFGELPADFSADRALLQPASAAAATAQAVGQRSGATAAGQATQAAGMARVLSVTSQPAANTLPLVAPMAQAMVQVAAAKPLSESVVTSGADPTMALPQTGGAAAGSERGRGDTAQQAGAEAAAAQDVDALAQKIARSVMVRLKRERERRGLYG